MYIGRMNLKELIEWLEKQNPNSIVKDGFGCQHSDRVNYSEVAFNPCGETTFGEMLIHAKSAIGATFEGWKGGEFTMNEYTPCYIVEFGDRVEAITSAHFKLWLLTQKGESK